MTNALITLLKFTGGALIAVANAATDLTPSADCVNAEGTQRDSKCRAETARIQQQIAAVYGLDRHTALADFRTCRDFADCFHEACRKSPRDPGITTRELKTASRPFVMFNRSGKPAKGVVALGHGMGGSPYDIGWIADELSKRGYHVVAGLLPGHGADYYSPKQAITADDYRNAYARTLEIARQLFPSLELTAGGSSTSGALAVDYLLRNPEDQTFVKKLLLIDPALALDSFAETALKRELVRGAPVMRGALAVLEAGAAPYTSEGDNSSPAWFGFKGSVHARPLMAIINDIRKTDPGRTISTPTFAVFSNGGDDIVPVAKRFAKIVDPHASRTALYGPNNRGGGRLSHPDRDFLDLGKADPSQGRLRPVLHRQVTLKEDIGRCKRHVTAGDNPYFDEMMTQVADFMDRNEKRPGRVRETNRPIM